MSTCVCECVQQESGVSTFIHCVIEHSLSAYCISVPCLARVRMRNGVWEGGRREAEEAPLVAAWRGGDRGGAGRFGCRVSVSTPDTLRDGACQERHGSPAGSVGPSAFYG